MFSLDMFVEGRDGCIEARIPLLATKEYHPSIIYNTDPMREELKCGVHWVRGGVQPFTLVYIQTINLRVFGLWEELINQSINQSHLNPYLNIQIYKKAKQGATSSELTPRKEEKYNNNP